MKRAVTSLNVISALYSLGWGIIFLGFSFFGMILSIGGSMQFSWIMPVDFILGPFLIWGAVKLFRKPKTKYLYGIIVWAVVLVVETYGIVPFLVLRNWSLVLLELQNAAFFIVPIILIYIAMRLDEKSSTVSPTVQLT